jgi:hypothetical protein
MSQESDSNQAPLKRPADPAAGDKPPPPMTPATPPAQQMPESESRRSSPALRLAAWIFAFVVLLAILAWALTSRLQ